MKDLVIRILCVDDVMANAKLLKKVLQKKKYYQVDICSSAKEALKLQKKAPYDLILTDYIMEGQDGLELLKKIKSDYASTEVIMVTAFANIKSAVQAMKYGAFDYIEKPIQPELLLKKVKQIKKNLERQDNYEDQEYGLLKVQEEAEANMLEFQNIIARYQSFTESLQTFLNQQTDFKKEELLEFINSKMKDLPN